MALSANMFSNNAFEVAKAQNHPLPEVNKITQGIFEDIHRAVSEAEVKRESGLQAEKPAASANLWARDGLESPSFGGSNSHAILAAVGLVNPNAVEAARASLPQIRHEGEVKAESGIKVDHADLQLIDPDKAKQFGALIEASIGRSFESSHTAIVNAGRSQQQDKGWSH